MIKKILTIYLSIILLKELYLSITDKIFHMTLVLAVIFVLCIWYGRKYREEEYVIDNYISITCAVLWGVLAFVTAWYAPKYFESSEPVSGGIGWMRN